MEANITNRNFLKTVQLSSKVNWRNLGLLSCRCLHVFGFLLMVNLDSAQSNSYSHSHINDFSSLKLHPRILEFHPDYVNGAEGSKIDGLNLKKTIVIVTPGLLIPSDNIEELHPPWSQDKVHLCNFQEFSKYHNSEKVRAYLEILAIKEKFKSKKVKSGFKFLSPLTESSDCASKKLSAAGVAYLIHLGQYLRQAYSGQLSSLNEFSHLLDLAETYGEETLFQSLNALLYGLLTEKQFISIDIDKKSQDFSIVSLKTPQHHHDLQHFVEQSYETESHLLKDSKLDVFDQNVDVPAKHVVLYLLNILYSILNDTNTIRDIVQNSHFLNSKFLSYKGISRLFNSSDIHTRYLSSNSAFKLYAESRTYSVRQYLKNVLLNENEVVNKDLKVIAIDDLLMLSLLVSLNMSVNRHLPPASRLVIELFETTPFMHINPFTQNGKDLPVSPDHSADNLGSKLPSQIQPDENSPSPGEISLAPGQVLAATLQSLKNSSPSFPLFNILSKQNKSKQTDIPLKSNQNPLHFVRVLYNGQVVTAQLGGCSHDTLIRLGLCVRSSLEHLFDLLEKVQSLKEEL